jgi:hypothetical protein
MTLNRFLEPPAVDLIREYFATKPDGAPLYTGPTFDQLAGGGDRPATVNRITEDDLVAVTMLSVEVPARAAIAVLGPMADGIQQLLSEIPSDVDLHEADLSLVSPGSPADRLWSRLESLEGVGWVTAGKLLARKRPKLIPVYDSVVREAVGAPKLFWTWLHEQLQDPELIERIRAVRTEADVEHLSLLRTLDVAIWMRNHG